MKNIPTRTKNPNGLHQRYYVEKVNGEPIDPKAEYFVLRVDLNGSDSIHIAACRKALMTYANEIKHHLPKLSSDLIERYGKTQEIKTIDELIDSINLNDANLAFILQHRFINGTLRNEIVRIMKEYAQSKPVEEKPTVSPCPNCKETVNPCACMKNTCIRCGKPVGNITFSVCDDCWDKNK